MSESSWCPPDLRRMGNGHPGIPAGVSHRQDSRPSYRAIQGLKTLGFNPFCSAVTTIAGIASHTQGTVRPVAPVYSGWNCARNLGGNTRRLKAARRIRYVCSCAACVYNPEDSTQCSDGMRSRYHNALSAAIALVPRDADEGIQHSVLLTRNVTYSFSTPSCCSKARLHRCKNSYGTPGGCGNLGKPSSSSNLCPSLSRSHRAYPARMPVTCQ
jgi:hypothetical protein